MKVDFFPSLTTQIDLNGPSIVFAFQAQTLNSKNPKKELEENKIELCVESNLKKELQNFDWLKSFKAEKGEIQVLTFAKNKTYIFLGLGKEVDLNTEVLRRNVAVLMKYLRSKKILNVIISLDDCFKKIHTHKYIISILEAFYLTHYQFTKHKSHPSASIKEDYKLTLITKNLQKNEFLKIDQEIHTVCSSINLIRDWINECPALLNSETYSKLVEADAKKSLSNVQIKILGKAQLEKEKMNLFLSVNKGSAFEPKLVHLTYQPAKNSSQNHFVLVGKGITYDTGGYSLKPATSMMGMHGDMGGSATVYGAFRSAVLNKCPHKISCLLVMTDNMINSLATTPNTIITGRSGKTVEILNTDAEGRLILADALDYACDLKPTAIIDVATLTGACIVSLGKEVCALLGNNDMLMDELKKSAKSTDEYIWQLPIVQEYRDDIKSKVADIKNIGSPMRAGTAIGAVFLECFIKNNIPWAHLDIAGVSDDQSHLPYCPAHGASGIMVRTLYQFLMHGKFE